MQNLIISSHFARSYYIRMLSSDWLRSLESLNISRKSRTAETIYINRNSSIIIMLIKMMQYDKSHIKKRLLQKSDKILNIFELEPAVLHLSGSTMIVGDLHGDLNALGIVLSQADLMDVKNVLFLGDYVDRGTHGAEVLLALFILKAVNPTKYYMLRGNHEDEHMNRHYGFFEEIGRDDTFLMRMHDVFQSMPIAAVIDNKVFCVHGGINEDTDIDNITKTDSYQYVWNDPGTRDGMHYSTRGAGISEYGPNIVKNFLTANNFTYIVRSHEFKPYGYEWMFKGKLLSIFSSINYCGRKNEGAFGIYEDGELKVYMMSEDSNEQEDNIQV